MRSDIHDAYYAQCNGACSFFIPTAPRFRAAADLGHPHIHVSEWSIAAKTPVDRYVGGQGKSGLMMLNASLAARNHGEPARRSEFASGEVTPARSNIIKLEMDDAVCLNFMKSNGGTENVGPLQVRAQPP